jgi:hypothetical protein
MRQTVYKKYPVMERHRCESSRIADWVIHECPECDYQLWENLLTGEIKVLNAKVNINHSGFYVPEEYCESAENLN